jgi:hypothetical protein
MILVAEPARRPAALPDETALICAYATRGRPNHRVGGLNAADMRGIDGLLLGVNHRRPNGV